MPDYDDFPYIVIEKRSAGLGPFIWGAIIGAGAALLLAPRPGVQTQEDIRRGVRRVQSTYHRTRERIEDGIETVRGSVDTVREQIDNVRDRFDARADDVRDHFDEGRRRAEDARDQLDRRVAEARDAAAGRTTPVGDRGADVVVIDVTEERSEGRADLG
jgi:gas vesicle protein